MTEQLPLELTEYETESFEMTREQADELRTVAAGRLTVGLSGEAGCYEVGASSHVGAIVTSHVTVLVRPKVPLHNLFLLLGVSPPDLDDSVVGLGTDADLLSVMAAIFARAVDRATIRGVSRGYRDTEDKLVSPRGRIDIVEQIRQPALASPVACRFDEYTADWFPNQVLVAALDRLSRVPGLTGTLRTPLNRLLPRFEGVRLVSVDPTRIDRWQFTRLDQHYETPLRMASIILRNLTLNHRGGATVAASFTVDMNQLFQDFVADRLERNLRRRLEFVGEPTVPLATSGQLKMLPDLVFRRRGVDVYVGDAKYKLSKGTGRMADYYQMLAYLTAMDLDEGVLVYAQDPGDVGDPIGEELVHTVRVRNTDKSVHVYRLPLAGSNDEVEAALENLASWIHQRAGIGMEVAA